MRDLAARLREIVRQEAKPRGTTPPGASDKPGPARELTYIPEPDPSEVAGSPAEALGGRTLETSEACVSVDRLYAANRSYGRQRVEAMAPVSSAPLHLFDRRVPSDSAWWRRVVFFDIETTGLSGGAGTLAFLAGCGWFEDDGFRVRQFLLAAPSGERAMLEALSGILAEASLLVTYNGRTFDVPFMEMRWAFHRTGCPTDGLAHFDMLPTARRLWRRREDDQSCSLTAIERGVLGVHRVNDVPSFEIPSRYFHFLRTGDAAAVEPVLEHNRADLVSLAAAMSHALWLAQEGPEACRESGEQLALGSFYERAGDADAAHRAYEMAAARGDFRVRREALARLAAGFRRAARHDAAARAWEQVLELSPAHGTESPLDRRAAEALAVHHEHRRKDLAAAKRYAETLQRKASGSFRRAVDHRINRIETKITRQTDGLQFERAADQDG